MVRKHAKGASSSPFPPTQNHGTTFSVLIPTPSLAKIKAVASYKRQQLAKKLARSALGKEAEAGEWKSGGGAFQSTLDSDGGLILQAPSIGVVIPANKMQSVSDESIHRDLQGFDRNFFLLRREMNSLTSVRMSLLWLLKKTTELELQINNMPANPPPHEQSK